MILIISCYRLWCSQTTLWLSAHWYLYRIKVFKNKDGLSIEKMLHPKRSQDGEMNAKSEDLTPDQQRIRISKLFLNHNDCYQSPKTNNCVTNKEVLRSACAPPIVGACPKLCECVALSDVALSENWYKGQTQSDNVWLLTSHYVGLLRKWWRPLMYGTRSFFSPTIRMATRTRTTPNAWLPKYYAPDPPDVWPTL